MQNADCTTALQKQQTNNENMHGKIGIFIFVKLRQGSGKDRQAMAIKAKGLKAETLA